MAYPMIDSLAGARIVLDGMLMDVSAESARICFEPVDDTLFYEVIRIESQVPLFWEDHLLRLERSIAGRFPISASLYDDALQLLEANRLERSNLRLVLNRQHTVLHQIESYYPSALQMTEGVATGILNWERANPNVKIVVGSYKEAVAARFAAGGPQGALFELLLADSNGQLTEGSRSNLFFIQGNQVFSAPDHLILKGITRQYVTAAIEAAGGERVERLFTLHEIEAGAVEAAFLSGSPIDLLPIRAIESASLASAGHPLFARINQAYQAIVHDYLLAHGAKLN